MSRSYATLAAALIGIGGIAAIAQVTTGGDDPAASADAPAAEITPADTPAPIVDVAAADTPVEVVTEQVDNEASAPLDTDCTISKKLELGDTDAEVTCLESQLIVAGALGSTAPDEVFDEATDEAVKTFQEANGLIVDGIVGPQTASQLGSWVGPDVLPPDPESCPDSGRSAVVDRFNQRAWLCENGAITDEMPMTSAITQPDQGTYQVYAKDLNASSNISGDYSEMTHFVAFTYGKYQGARIAFHSIPKYRNGEFVQPLESVGTQELYGASSGCIRVLPEDAEMIWNWLDIGDTVIVVT